MPWNPPHPDDPAPAWWGAVAVSIGLAVMIPAGLVAAFQMDEANVFRHVTNFASGKFNAPGRPGLLWLLLTPTLRLNDPASAALAARWVCMGASLVTFLSVHRLAKRAAGGPAAAVATLLLATSMTWAGRSFELRTDTFTTPLLLVAAILLWRRTLPAGRAVAIGVLVGAAGLISQKAVYGAAGIGAGWLTLVALGHAKRELRGPAIAAATALGVIAVWYAGLAWVNDDAVVAKNLAGAASNAFTAQKPLIKKLLALGWAGNRAPVLYASLLPGLWIAWRERRRAPLLAAAVVLGLVHLSTIAWHRGFYLYYVAHFEPVFAVVGGAGIVALWRRLGRLRWLIPLACAFALPSALHYYRFVLATHNGPQLAVMREAKRAFPEPVPYWDGVGLVPGYRETTLFNTGANRRGHRERHGDDFLVGFARARQPRFFVRTYLSRDLIMHWDERRYLWRHYVPYRPNLYLRGGRIKIVAGQTRQGAVEVGPAGAYTVWFWGGWDGTAFIDERAVRHGDVVELTEGEVTLRAEATDGAGQLWLILGEDRAPLVERTADLIDHALFPEVGRRGWFDHHRQGGKGGLFGPPRWHVLDGMSSSAEANRRELHRRYQLDRDARWGWPPEPTPAPESTTSAPSAEDTPRPEGPAPRGP